MARRMLTFLVGVIALAVLLAGCGSSGSSGSSGESEGALTKAEFIEKGNKICARANAKVKTDARAFAEEHSLSGGELSRAEEEELIEEVGVPELSSVLDELRALGTPQGDEGELNKLLASLEELVEEAEDDPATVFLNEDGKAKAFNKRSREYGLTVCGEEEGNEG